ncbi:MAG TPA: DUF1579 domain-containing protein [Planctomycetota bacterium]
MIALLTSLLLAQDMTAKPVKEHEVLKKFEGEWDCVMKFMMEPGKEPMVSKGTESCKLIMGGLFLITTVDAEMLGGKFFGHGIMGYDVQKKKYTGSWVDSMATGQYTVEGTLEGNVLTETMEGSDPASGQPFKMKLIHELKDKDNRVMKFVMTGPDGKDLETGGITYTRKK